MLNRLEPWLDFEMWKGLEERKKATRVNVDYEEQLRQMQEGTWQVDNTIPPASTSVEELDVIKIEER